MLRSSLVRFARVGATRAPLKAPLTVSAKVPLSFPLKVPILYSYHRMYSSAPALTREIITERILELLEDYDNIKLPEKISVNANFKKDLGLDSLDQVEIIMEIENEFSIIIPDDKADEINTVKDAIDLIEAQPDAV
ncbi:hypothetical protein PACTADRAFT_49344 [Pachysolen tannophilus NRRL Y-2460]|uniref:Acyl carrier protein n=1 Tax=Pachysolen tannophilus NRRL Y-2460 TaxID=669874 RepID=A0A1E4TW03_PACTA|nr:hypothetical protein PACTADRAFT_49344 [Pachysolen tannophilus NRRL Y-2460]